MAADRDQAIRERAYHLWVAGGRQEGTCDQDWLRAEQDLGASGEGTASAVAQPSAAKTAIAEASTPKPGAAKPRRPASGRGKVPTSSELDAAVGGVPTAPVKAAARTRASDARPVPTPRPARAPRAGGPA